MKATKLTHRLIIQVGLDNNVEYKASSFKRALELYDELRALTKVEPWGYQIVAIKSQESN